jgi:nicotinamide-nucleotide amidase
MLGRKSMEAGHMPDLTPLAAAVGALLKERQENIAVADSSAGGLISASLLSVPGASAYYVGGVVSYTGVSRGALLGISEDDMAKTGMRASTEPYAALIAKTVREKFGTTWGISETGASGPTGNRYGDASGHACFAVSGPVERTITLETRSSDREANMWAFTKAALELLEDCLKS